jgi:drug/metabolite transporter (DMT)-like permease
VGAAYLALAGAVVVWGLSFPVLKVAVARLGPLDVGVLRVVLGALGSVALWLCDRRGRRSLGALLRRHPGKVLLLSCLVGCGQNFSLTYGILHTPATVASLIPPLNPIATMLLAAWVLGERIVRRQWVGMGLAVAGVVALALRHGAPTWETVAGPLVLALAPTSWAVYTVVSKPLLAEVTPMTLTAVTLVGGALLTLPLAGRLAVGRLAAATALEWGAVLYLGFVAMALAYALWYVGLARVGAGASGATVLGMPLVGVASSALLLDERLGPATVLAGALIVGGLHLVLARRG